MKHVMADIFKFYLIDIKILLYNTCFNENVNSHVLIFLPFRYKR